MTFHFDDALTEVIGIVARLQRQGLETTVVRDVLGRCRLVVDNRLSTDDVPDGLLTEAISASAVVGPFGAGKDGVVLATDLVDSGALLDDPTRAYISAPGDSTAVVPVIERTIIGAEWRSVEERQPSSIPQVVFYSLKGGVGRTTAAVFLARGLAEQGHCVVLADLDLESPGLGGLLLSSEGQPDYGIVDIMVESAVGFDVAPDCIARCMERSVRGNGEVWLAPAAGRQRESYTYLPKLDRCYLDLPSTDGGLHLRFADRLTALLASITSAVEARSRRPSILLIDSRAGMHDLAGVALTHLADLGLLFASDTEQTWWGYRALLEQWQERPEQAQLIRERLKLVAAMVDKVNHDAYLTRMVDRSASCFEAIYDSAAPNDIEVYSPAPTDRTAPHYPLPILFDQDLRQLTAPTMASALLSGSLRAAYGVFVEGVQELLGDNLLDGAS